MNEQTPSTFPSHLLRPVLWSLLVLGAVGNMVASTASAGLTAHLVFGAITAASAAGLLTIWMRTRA